MKVKFYYLTICVLNKTSKHDQIFVWSCLDMRDVALRQLPFNWLMFFPEDPQRRKIWWFCWLFAHQSAQKVCAWIFHAFPHAESRKQSEKRSDFSPDRSATKKLLFMFTHLYLRKIGELSKHDQKKIWSCFQPFVEYPYFIHNALPILERTAT